MALVGGARIDAPLHAGYWYEEGGILSPDGHCKVFDAEARGTVFGNGVAMIVIKRLSDAIRDGDSIQAVIKASAINNDGSSKVGYPAPSVQGQASVIEEALTMAEVSPDTIGYIEAHGTGTPLGDPIEAAALTTALSRPPAGTLSTCRPWSSAGWFTSATASSGCRPLTCWSCSVSSWHMFHLLFSKLLKKT